MFVWTKKQGALCNEFRLQTVLYTLSLWQFGKRLPWDFSLLTLDGNGSLEKEKN